MTDEQLEQLAIDERNELLGDPLVYVPGCGWVGELQAAWSEDAAESLLWLRQEGII